MVRYKFRFISNVFKIILENVLIVKYCMLGKCKKKKGFCFGKFDFSLFIWMLETSDLKWTFNEVNSI